jgi:Tfp pilus assembly protein PilO
MEDQKKDNQAALIGLIIILVLAIFYFGVYYQGKSLHTAELSYKAKSLQATALAKNVSSLQSLQAQFSSQNSTLSKLQTAFPANAKPEEIIVMLNAMATNAGVTVNNIQPDQQNTNTSSSLPAANITVTVTGDYNAQSRFSSELAKNIRPITINNISLVGQPNSGDISGTYNLGFLIANSSSVNGGNQ